jgi:regulatory protein
VRITKIENQKKTPGRASIFADGEFLIGLSTENFLRAGLRVGDEISSQLVKELTARETLLAVKNAALRLLSVRPRSEHELTKRLLEKEFAEQDIRTVLDELKAAGLVDDATFARMFIRNTFTLRPLGEMQVRRKLLLLGVPRPVIDGAVRETFSEVDVSAVALDVARTYLKRLKRSPVADDPRKNRNKVAAHLARRGYQWSTISAVLKSLDLPEEERTDDEPSGV